MSINITYSTDSNGITTAMFESTESNAVLLNGTDSLKTTVNGKDTIASRAIIRGITTIGESAFRDSTSLTSIELDTSVTTIDKWAFWGSGLTSIIIPSSVTTIGISAFWETNSLTSIKIQYGITTIGDYAFFYATSLTSIEIPNSVITIGRSAFSGSGLTSIIIPSSVTTIESWAFSDTKLSSVIIPSSVTAIGANAFSMSSLKTVYIEKIPNALNLIETSNTNFYGATDVNINYVPNTSGATPNTPLSIGAIVGISIGSLVALVGIIYGIVLFIKKNKLKKLIKNNKK